ncbi:hotdog fold thioesterase [Methanoregula sp.]|jgi:acyl-CoA thioesterase|uniref:hotdog fold thioesterase n=1 Tax=Methanoregula sp. TaxID=2052170 RepID=UPI0025D807DF|nr:hotdog fold thioesterase [Methanoregula sp.]
MTSTKKTPDEQPSVSVSDHIAAFEDSAFARLLDMHITEARNGYARVEMDCAGKLNPHGTAHGGAVFSLADHAFGIASNCGTNHYTAVSVHIQYLVPVKGKDRLAAVAERVAANGTCETYRVMVYEGDRAVAVFDGVAFRVS